MISDLLKPFLDDIEERIDVHAEDEILTYISAWSRHEAGSQDRPRGRMASPSRLDWPNININDAIADDEKMLLSEFGRVNQRLSIDGSFPLRVRSNFGVGNVASAFGAELFVMPRESNTLPNVTKLGEEKCIELIDQPLPDKYAGNFADIYRVGSLFREIADTYPKIGKYVHVEQPDLQGPMDNLELLWGSELFYALYDLPDEIHALLEKISAFIRLQINGWLALFPENRGRSNYFRYAESGSLVLRDDSAMNLSPKFFSEYIAPYDGGLLKEYGGIVHFCGRGDHFIELLADLEGLKGINMSQPHLNDMDKVFSATIDRGIHLSLSVDPFEVRGHDTANLVFLPRE
ncbi:MAG: hypothetical protein K5663_00305 [Clostridiales bacterium]|nr:hypothetical protein [Clostridiales bacterium]